MQFFVLTKCLNLQNVRFQSFSNSLEFLNSWGTEHSLFGHWWSDEGIVSCDGTVPIVDPLLLSGLVELEHGEGLLGASHLTHTNDDLATALEDRVQGLVDENGDGLGGLGIVVRIVAGLLC